jgi:hypothetical protein
LGFFLFFLSFRGSGGRGGGLSRELELKVKYNINPTNIVEAAQ